MIEFDVIIAGGGIAGASKLSWSARPRGTHLHFRRRGPHRFRAAQPEDAPHELAVRERRRGARPRAGAATVFQAPDWLIAWWRHFAPGQLTCIALWRGEELVAIAPLYREEGSRRLLVGLVCSPLHETPGTWVYSFVSRLCKYARPQRHSIVIRLRDHREWEYLASRSVCSLRQA